MSVRQGNKIIAGVTSTNYNDFSNKPQINSIELVGNKSLDDLNIQDKETSLNYDYISNVIAEIPQNINLELSEDKTTVTLKADSIIYKPNGESFVVGKESTTNMAIYNGKRIIVCNTVTKNIANIDNLGLWSGDTEPEGPFYHFWNYWFDTTNKTIKQSNDKGVTWTENNFSLPLAFVEVENNLVKRMVPFNGIGFCGQALFALPGLKLVMPNGINENGTNKNYIVKTSNLFVVNNNGANRVNDGIGVYSNNTIAYWSGGFVNYVYELPKENIKTFVRYYLVPENKIYTHNGVEWITEVATFCGTFDSDSVARINNININHVFAVAKEEDLIKKADKADTLSGYNITDGIGYNNISNCVTKIPQDINLILDSAGKLTLKKDSIVYIPNGINNFTKEIVPMDFSISSLQTYTGNCQMYYMLNRSGFNYAYFDNTSSGTTSQKPQTGLFYNAEENSIDYYENSSKVIEKYSFPLCTVRVENGIIKEILQVFNGMGYIGKYMYLLPGVEMLSPNGKDNDGNNLNNKCIVDKVYITSPVDGVTSGYAYARYSENSKTVVYDYLTSWLSSQESPSNPFEYLMWYDRENNYIRQYLNGKWTNPYNTAIIANITLKDNKISSLVPNISLNVVTYDEYKDLFGLSETGKDLITNLSAPSNKYIDLELQASGSIYTAPANGWFALRKRSSAAGQAIELRNNTNNMSIRFSYSTENFLAGIYIPAKRGDKVYYESESTNTNNQQFVFVYAEGAK